jgi:hypothetical protein
MIKGAICEIINFLIKNGFDFDFSRDLIDNTVLYSLYVSNYTDNDIILRDNFVQLCQDVLNVDVEDNERKGVWWNTVKSKEVINDVKYECQFDIRLQWK